MNQRNLGSLFAHTIKITLLLTLFVSISARSEDGVSKQNEHPSSTIDFDAKTTTCKAPGSSLTLTRLEFPQHEKSWGKIRVELRLSDSRLQNKPMIQELDGIWGCIGYSPDTKKYILLGQFPLGENFVLVQGIRYLDEQTGKVIESQYSQPPESENHAALSDGIKAFSAIPSENMRYLVFIQYLAGKNSHATSVELRVLDTKLDQMKSLKGPVPVPPPGISTDANDTICKDFIEAHGNPLSWFWGNPCGLNVYLPLDPGVITFVGNRILQISYSSKDNHRERTGERKVTIYDLRKIFGKADTP